MGSNLPAGHEGEQWVACPFVLVPPPKWQPQQAETPTPQNAAKALHRKTGKPKEKKQDTRETRGQEQKEKPMERNKEEKTRKEKGRGKATFVQMG